MTEYKIIRSNAQYPAVFDTWTVIVVEGSEAISHHESEAEARAAIKRYQAADRRRAKQWKALDCIIDEERD
jgi:hypothetical protein